LNFSYVTPTPAGETEFTWRSSTNDVCLEKTSNPSDRIAAMWYSTTSFTVDLNFTDANTHQLAVCFVHWQYFNKNEPLDILDVNGNV
jgi:hypothetical protein